VPELAALEHHVLDATAGQFVTCGQDGLAGTDDDGLDVLHAGIVEARRRGDKAGEGRSGSAASAQLRMERDLAARVDWSNA
jgi:hypothetical protein